MTNELRDETDQLSLEVNELEGNIQELEETNRQLLIIGSDLRNQTERLGDQLENMNSTVADLSTENERLTQLNTDLETIVGFLNETSGEISDTFEGVATFLSERIETSRLLILQDVENALTLQMTGWDCNFRDIFRGEPFIVDDEAPIGAAALGRVLSYVEGRILSDFCADRVDFENYLDSRFGLTEMTAAQLDQGVAMYTSAILDYFFPNPGSSSGLTPEDWREAGYACENLPVFSYDQ